MDFLQAFNTETGGWGPLGRRWRWAPTRSDWKKPWRTWTRGSGRPVLWPSRGPEETKSANWLKSSRRAVSSCRSQRRWWKRLLRPSKRQSWLRQKLKLMHVEAGFPLEPWLARTIALCKKSMARERGPVKRAQEVGLECLKEDLWTFHGHVAVPGAVWAYAWGLCWMLREIELSKVRWGHMSWNQRKKTVRAVHTPLKDGPAGVGDSKKIAMLWRKPLLEGVCLVLGADHVEASGTCCNTSRGILVPQRQGRKAFEVGHGGFVEELVRYGSGGPLSEKVGSHGLRKKRHGRPSLSWAMEVLGGADVCGRGVGDDPCQQRPGASSGSGRPSSEDSQQHPGGGGSKGANRNRRCSSCRRTLGGAGWDLPAQWSVLEVWESNW